MTSSPNTVAYKMKKIITPIGMSHASNRKEALSLIKVAILSRKLA
jgi:hypothetical protein